MSCSGAEEEVQPSRLRGGAAQDGAGPGHGEDLAGIDVVNGSYFSTKFWKIFSIRVPYHLNHMVITNELKHKSTV
jgi:hypothetical protein